MLRETMMALMVWISAETGLPVPDSLPRVEFGNSCLMQERTRGERSARCSTSRSPEAVYIMETETIMLQPDWSYARPEGQMTLVHELVHHMQNHALGGVDGINETPCTWADWERQAYETELAYADAQGWHIEDRTWYAMSIVCTIGY